MCDQDRNNYFFLNREGQWPGFRWDGLEPGDDGALRLSSLPLFSGALPEALKTAPVPAGPAGLAIDCFGTMYYSDPDKDQVWRVDACDGSVSPVPCLGGSGSQFMQLSRPRGLLVPKHRHSLLIVDSGNHRVQIIDLATLQLLDVWGQANPAADPHPGSQPGQFNSPWAIAEDSQGSVYVVDYGNQRVQKFDVVGSVVSSFWTRIQASALLHQPADIAVNERNGKIWVFVLDATSSSIYVFDQDGNPILDSHGQPLAIADPALRQPMGLAAAADTVYVGDNARRRVFRFHVDADVTLVGEAVGYDGPVAALLLEGKGGLLVHPGDSLRPVTLKARGGCRTRGVLWGDAIRVVDRKAVWHRLQAVLAPLNKVAHLDLFVYASSKDGDAPAVVPDDASPFADPRWNSSCYAANVDLADLYIGSKEAKYLWVGALFSSDGTATPVLKQMRVEFDYPTYDRYLPAIYRNQATCGDFLVRLLSLCASFNEEVEDKIGALAALFDPKAAPKEFLAWLAGCVGLELDENWDEQKQRTMIAEFFRLSSRRGTASGLRDSLRLFAGVDVVIEEPILDASWWALPGTAESCCESCAAHNPSGTGSQGTSDSILGWTTMLAPAQPQGAVVGTSSDLDQSHLITNDDFGFPLFSDVAHRFTVGVYRGQVMCPDVLPRIRAILDQQKPAHTAYQLCIIEPRFRVGFQSRVGIDTVVGGPQRSLALGSEQLLGAETVLAGARASRLGVETRLGVTTQLG